MKYYQPTVTVTLRREFDGVVEREHSVAICGAPHQVKALEEGAMALIVLANALGISVSAP